MKMRKLIFLTIASLCPQILNAEESFPDRFRCDLTKTTKESVPKIRVLDLDLAETGGLFLMVRTSADGSDLPSKFKFAEKDKVFNRLRFCQQYQANQGNPDCVYLSQKIMSTGAGLAEFWEYGNREDDFQESWTSYYQCKRMK